MNIIKKAPIILPLIAFFDTLLVRATQDFVHTFESDFLRKLYRVIINLQFNSSVPFISSVLFFNNWILYLIGAIVLSVILVRTKQYALRQAVVVIGLNIASLTFAFMLVIRWM